jgi:dihydrofolate reductase
MEAGLRKIIESTLVSADGVVGDPPRWAMGYRDAQVTGEALERLADADAMLMGRGTYELFSATWPRQDGEFAERINSIRKYGSHRGRRIRRLGLPAGALETPGKLAS